MTAQLQIIPGTGDWVNCAHCFEADVKKKIDHIINTKMSCDILFNRHLFTIDMDLECVQVSKSTEHKQQQQKK